MIDEVSSSPCGSSSPISPSPAPSLPEIPPVDGESSTVPTANERVTVPFLWLLPVRPPACSSVAVTFPVAYESETRPMLRPTRPPARLSAETSPVAYDNVTVLFGLVFPTRPPTAATPSTSTSAYERVTSPSLAPTTPPTLKFSPVTPPVTRTPSTVPRLRPTRPPTRLKSPPVTSTSSSVRLTTVPLRPRAPKTPVMFSSGRSTVRPVTV